MKPPNQLTSMKTAGNPRQRLDRWRWLAFSITALAGLLIGLGLSLCQSEQPHRERSVSRLITDLQRRDSAFYFVRRTLWGFLPNRFGTGPMPAKEVRLNAAAELGLRKPKPTNALPALRRLLSDPDADVCIAGLKALQDFGTVAPIGSRRARPSGRSGWQPG
jgi:hypothetical protein